MISPDDLVVMNVKEKLDLIAQLAEAEEWRESFEPIFVELVNDDNPEVRQAAIVALWDVAEPRHIELLMSKAESDPDVDVRGKATSVLGIFIYEGSVDESLDQSQYLTVRRFLLNLAENDAESLLVQRMAIEALSFDADEVVQDLVASAYDHPADEMKLSAVFAMGRSALPRWHETLLEELGSASREMQIEAINAVNEAALEAATPALRNLANRSDKDVRLAAIWALSHTGGPGALETLEMCAQVTDDDDVRHAAEDAIEELHSMRQADDELDMFGDEGEDG